MIFNVFELRKKLHETKQGELTIAQYFAELSGLWQELDYYQEYQPVHPEDAASYKKVVDKERVYDFLAGLNLEYDQIRVQVLERDPFPNLRQTYAYVQQEESRRIAMLHVGTHERSAMVATPISKESKGVHTRGIEIARGSNKDDLQVGRGGRVVGPPRSRAHFSNTIESSPSTESSALNPKEMQHLRRLMAKLDGCPSTSAASSHHTPSHHALGIHSTTDLEPWIIDSRSLRPYDWLIGEMQLISAAYLINRMSLRTLDFKTPLDVLQGNCSFVVPPKVFGCVCFVHEHGKNISKLDHRALKCIFIGYSAIQKGYKCYHPPTRKTYVSMDVTFHESNAYFSTTPFQGESNSEEEVSYGSKGEWLPELLIEDKMKEKENEAKHDESITGEYTGRTNLGWDLQQLDVKNAFLHGDLAEEVYMEIPLGFSCQKTEGKVCKLKKSLYGLKQSPRAWFDRFQKAMLSFGYQQSNADHTMFVKHCHGRITILIVYVDDIVVTSDNLQRYPS
ncbi:Retrovirus-related Pol polyprotein from transposon TNT 1-94 [Quillaja saponaria]|uniref:Retrovirus-related Pol polyprotein from transposon TNT 1-94 n=1 Tax=Quillaja saponaria TaxID=32244 RepID=A0AAD7QC25_QUISA|nr:Retrovirus-related Pol polyprotein from transposon TNT 1-94 [Quillaja saponaria]